VDCHFVPVLKGMGVSLGDANGATAGHPLAQLPPQGRRHVPRVSQLSKQGGTIGRHHGRHFVPVR
jgi:hypothetical protein